MQKTNTRPENQFWLEELKLMGGISVVADILKLFRPDEMAFVVEQAVLQAVAANKPPRKAS